MVAWENLDLLLLAGLRVLFLHDLREILQDVGQPGRSQNAFPEIVCLHPVLVRRIPGPVVPALVERQKPRILRHPLPALERGTHRDLRIIHGEVNHAPSKFEQGLPRIAVPLVLLDGIVDRLLGQTVFQLKRHHRQSVDERTQVQSSFRLFATVRKLPRDTESVLCMPLDRLLIFRRWRAVEQVEAQSAVLDAVSQDVDGPTARDFSLQASEELLASDVLPILEINNAELRSLIRLRGFKERKKLFDVHSEFAIIGLGMTSKPAATTRTRRGLAHHVRIT